MKIKFSKLSTPRTGTSLVLVPDGSKLGKLAIDLDKISDGQITRALRHAKFSGRLEQMVEIAAPHNLALAHLIVVGIGNPKEISFLDAEKLGGAICAKLLAVKAETGHILVEDFSDLELSASDFACALASGAVLRNYRFDKYKTKTKTENGGNDKKPVLKEISILTSAASKASSAFGRHKAIADGVFLARDLVNEPPNELHPVSFAKRAAQLRKLGVKVEILGKKELTQKGFRALLGVAQGSVRPPQLVVMAWMGGKKDKAPLAFVGKGVTFDSGGISIKPSQGMGDMKGDMGGAACVTGLMHTLAARKARVNAIGVIGLVENMPDAAAQRPGDIVKSMSGQTIEVLNTDAEGRLVLADALWYTQKRFKPQFMIDLATLTGAIMVALGKEHAGMFSNSDELAERLAEAGNKTAEKVWRMPLAAEYDKMIDSKVADVQNIGGRFAGSITAAQFLQRFVNEVPWAHLDIAGTAMGSPKTQLNTSWSSGYGVRLLNQLVADYYEK